MNLHLLRFVGMKDVLAASMREIVYVCVIVRRVEVFTEMSSDPGGG